MVLTITEPIGHGEMTLELISPWFVAAKVDFTCDYCPNMTQNPLQQGEGRWLSVNYCHEGRCEVDMGPAGCAVVKADDFCISCADRWPDGFRYPAGCYRGVELWINTELLQDPSFLLLAEAGISLDALADAANPASVFAADDSLIDPWQNIGNALVQGDSHALATPDAKVSLSGFYWPLPSMTWRMQNRSPCFPLISCGLSVLLENRFERIQASLTTQGFWQKM